MDGIEVDADAGSAVQDAVKSPDQHQDLCAGKTCDDANPCTADKCNPASGSCVHPTIEAACDDGNGCTVNDFCKSGQCVAGAAKDCDDANVCTTGEACVDGACKTGKGVFCDDGKLCTFDACDPLKGCQFKDLDLTACDDNDQCTLASACENGKCTGGKQTIDCDDGNPCTDDKCAAQKGCVHQLNGAACDDGNPCTQNDKCALGKCYSGAKDPKCACSGDKDCQAFDTNLCDGVLLCNLATHQCELDAKTVVKCKSGPCFIESCAPATGKCGHSNKPNGAPCDADGDACTVADRCQTGACMIGTPAICNDGNPCTDDGCAQDSGCVHAPNQASCTDSNPCTTGDACAGKACQPGSAATCDDGLPCTKDACVIKSGGCTHDSNAQDGDACDADGSVCTVGDVCKVGVCVNGKQLQCDDSNACTTDSCHPIKGCQYTANSSACDDTNPCTQFDHCAGGVCQSGPLKACIDGDKCTKDGCDAKTGACEHTQVTGCSSSCSVSADCNDTNPCTDDTCDGGTCSNKVRSGSCDDESACTTGDACQDGVCRGLTKSCVDGNVCTDDDCAPKSGCQNAAVTGPCDADGNACTIGDACKAGGCVAGGVKKCDDGNPCTLSSCDGKTGDCGVDTKALNGQVCDADGSLCSHDDRCDSGVCKPGKALPCDDDEPCTGDSCAAKTGCTHAILSGPCDDDDKCTATGTCDKGKCSTTALVCNDGDVCTSDGCDAQTGKCVTTPITGCASDCKTNADCHDNNPCTVDECAVGKCQHVGRQGTCAGGDKCFVAGECKAGTCVGGKTVDCNDGNACTDDSCDGAKGTCNFAGNTAPCDDGDLCTTGDACAFAKCAAGVAKDCDDKQVCTDDACDQKTGKCVYSHNTAPCDDANGCTAGDRCDKGTCGAGELGVATLTVGDGVLGYVDGPLAKARFGRPSGVWLSSSGTVLVADSDNNAVRTIEVDGSATTWAGDGQPGFINGPRKGSRFNAPASVVVDTAGNIYVADAGNHVVRVIDSKGVVTHFAGDGAKGSQDGYGTKARLHTPTAMAIDAAGIYVTDVGNHNVVVVTLDGLVGTLAGGGEGYKDDVGTNARFSGPRGIAAAPDGTLFVGDTGNHRIRRISLTGVVTTVAGTGLKGQTDGPATQATFESPAGLFRTALGDLLVADTGNNRIRVLDTADKVRAVLGDGWTTTLFHPYAVAVDGLGHAWVADTDNRRLRRFDMPIRQCDDANTCTTDTCDTKTGACVFTGRANGSGCGQGCLLNQFCKATECSFGIPKSCDDFNKCTSDYCSHGVCKNVAIAGCN